EGPCPAATKGVASKRFPDRDMVGKRDLAAKLRQLGDIGKIEGRIVRSSSAHLQARHTIADVESHRSDGRPIAQPRPDGEVRRIEANGSHVWTHITRIHEQHATELSGERKA